MKFVKIKARAPMSENVWDVALNIDEICLCSRDGIFLSNGMVLRVYGDHGDVILESVLKSGRYRQLENLEFNITSL